MDLWGCGEGERGETKLFSVHLIFFYAAALFEFVLLDGNNELMYAYQIGFQLILLYKTSVQNYLHYKASLNCI